MWNQMTTDIFFLVTGYLTGLKFMKPLLKETLVWVQRSKLKYKTNRFFKKYNT